MSEMKYTGGGGTTHHTPAFKVRFKKSFPEFDIEEGEESKVFVVKMSKLIGIMVYTAYGVKHFFKSYKNEEDVLDVIEFLEESNPN